MTWQFVNLRALFPHHLLKELTCYPYYYCYNYNHCPNRITEFIRLSLRPTDPLTLILEMEGTEPESVISCSEKRSTLSHAKYAEDLKILSTWLQFVIFLFLTNLFAINWLVLQKAITWFTNWYFWKIEQLESRGAWMFAIRTLEEISLAIFCLVGVTTYWT